MDLASISTAFTAIDFIRKGLAAAIDVRDFNKAAAELSNLNEALISAQTALLAQNSALFSLQNEKFEMAEKLRKLEESLAERGRYSLVELAPEHFVYQVNATPQDTGDGSPREPQPLHHLCQPCFDTGSKAVLQQHTYLGTVYLRCPTCKNKYDSGQRQRMSY